MRTAREMLNFALTRGYGREGIIKRGAKHFAIIESQLAENEYVKFTFLGEYKRDAVENLGGMGFAVTDEKIIAGQQRIGGTKSKQFEIAQINDISKRSYMLFGEIVITTRNDMLSVLMNSGDANRTYNGLVRVLEEIRINRLKTEQRQKEAEQTSQYDFTMDIRRYKALADEGYITYDDYEAIKRKLLGLY